MLRRVTNWTPLQPRCRGIPKRRWLDDVEEDIRAMKLESSVQGEEEMEKSHNSSKDTQQGINDIEE